nr:oligosaccharide flippase family protein [uncultured Roseateles sp.]
MSSIRRSLLFQLADNYIGVVLQLASTLIIARLLTPSEIGIFAVASVLAALASQFRDFGLGEYLIQEKVLTQQKIRAAFAANIMSSWLMAAVFFAASWPAAVFYNQPGVGDVMRIQSINFLLVPFGAVTMAFFRRELNYRPIFIAGLTANITTFLVATAGALAGFSYLSLALSSLAGLIVTVAVSVIFRPKDFPRWPSLKGFADVFHFSKHAMGIYFFGQIGKSAPEAVIGRALDMASVAFFSRANGLMEIFNRTVLRAALPLCLPYFAQESRKGERTAPGYLKATTLLTGVGWPFFVVIGILAFSAIRLLYGAQWMPSVPLAQILCLVAVLELPYWLATEVMIAEGRIDQSNRLQFIVQGLRLSSLVLVFPFGLPGACGGLAIAALLGAWVSHRFLHRIIGLHFAEVVKACMPSAMVTLITALPAALLCSFVTQSEGNFLFVFLGCGVCTIAVWLFALKLCHHPFWPEVLLISGKLKARFGTAAVRPADQE